MPALQAVQIEPALPARIEPGLHGVQLLLPASEIVPAGQAAQTVAPSLLKYPAPHWVQPVAPLEPMAVPPGHGLQLRAPVTATKVPGSQSKQLEEPADGEYSPNPQGEQFVCALAEKDPGAQAIHCAAPAAE